MIFLFFGKQSFSSAQKYSSKIYNQTHQKTLVPINPVAEVPSDQPSV